MSEQSEIQLQADIFQWAWNNHPETRQLLYAVPNGGKRSAREANALKASGVVAGIPDLVFLWKGKTYAFELKVEGRRTSNKQDSAIEKWKYHGADCYIIRDQETFKYIFLKILNKAS